MTYFNYLTLQGFIDKNLLDDEARFWLELDEIPEMNPIREYKNIVIDEPYEHSVSFDLETRVAVLIELIANVKYNRSNPRYLVKLANRLIQKCRETQSPHLELQLLNALSLL